VDKELLILENIQNNNEISQRQLSDDLGISLGSVNTLLKKMKRDGLIKVKEIPANRVAYMLTSEGIIEKANKTYNYVRVHYKFINDTKNKIKDFLNSEIILHDKIYIAVKDLDFIEIVRLAVRELNTENVIVGNELILVDVGCESLIITDNLEGIVEGRFNNIIDIRSII
jgi:DNA-binding MarR family transcriptional regulator